MGILGGWKLGHLLRLAQRTSTSNWSELLSFAGFGGVIGVGFGRLRASELPRSAVGRVSAKRSFLWIGIERDLKTSCR